MAVRLAKVVARRAADPKDHARTMGKRKTDPPVEHARRAHAVKEAVQRAVEVRELVQKVLEVKGGAVQVAQRVAMGRLVAARRPKQTHPLQQRAQPRQQGAE